MWLLPQEKQGGKAVSENLSLAHFKTTGFNFEGLKLY